MPSFDELLRQKRRKAFYAMTARGGNWNPRKLFRANEQGFIYDPSDLSTLYRDPAGTTPVTAVGQTVGLVLDKSKGLVLGSELVTNGGFDSGLTDWNLDSPGSASVVNGKLVCASNGNVWQDVGANNGGNWEISLDVIATGVGNAVCYVGGIASSAAVDPAAAPAGTRFTARVVNSSGSRATQFIFGGNNAGWTVDNISVRELPGNHATQSVLASRPILQQDANGKFYLLFDGSDDFLVTNTITPGTDKAQVFAGVRKLSDALAGCVINSSTNLTGLSGTFELAAPRTTSETNYRMYVRGTAATESIATPFVAPITNVVTALADISVDQNIVRVNGSQSSTNAGDLGTGNFGAHPLYIGRRHGTSNPFNGRIYGLIARFGPNLSDVQIAQTEQWLNSKTGAF